MSIGASWTFAQIPDVVLFSDLSSNAKVMFAALHKYSTLPKGAIPSHERLSQDLVLSVSTVRRAIDELKAAGFLVVTPRHGTSSMYTLLIGEQTPRSPVSRPPAHPWTTIENEGERIKERESVSDQSKSTSLISLVKDEDIQALTRLFDKGGTPPVVKWLPKHLVYAVWNQYQAQKRAARLT